MSPMQELRSISAAAIVVLALAGCGLAPGRTALAQPSFGCRLPVGSRPAGLGGFVHFPGGTFTPDPQSTSSFDAGRWLPINRAEISPDGTAYAVDEYVKDALYTTGIHVVDITSGKDRAVWRVDGADTVAGWTEDGIFFIRYALHEPNFAGPDLWLLDPTTGQQRIVTPQPPVGAGLPLFKAWTALGGNAIWTWSVTAGRPAKNVLLRVDLTTGQATTWMAAAGDIDVLGWDAHGHPFVAVGGGLVRLLGPNQPAAVESIGFRSPPTMPPSVVTDDHGSWFAALDGSIWLLPGGSDNMEKVAAVPLPVPTPPRSDIGFQISLLLIAGGCA